MPPRSLNFLAVRVADPQVASTDAVRRTAPIAAVFALTALFAGATVLLAPGVVVSENGLTAAQRLDAEHDVRTSLLQYFGGLVVILGAYFTAQNLKINRRNAELAEQGQITERFTRAIDQLGNAAALDVRLGGIYALERIAHDSSARDHVTTMEVLSAYLREHARWSAADTRGDTERSTEETRVPADVHAALTVLARRDFKHDDARRRLDLSGTDLRSARLPEAHLEGANLSQAHLEDAVLFDAHLKGTLLFDANLDRANLFGANLVQVKASDAHLEGAVLERADLSGARLDRAALFGAQLKRANLSGASLEDAHLEGADLSHANLERADLSGAHLEGADLSGAHLDGAVFFDAHLENAILIGVDLSRVKLASAHLEGAHLERAGLTT